jgi:hypothetical protein
MKVKAVLQSVGDSTMNRNKRDLIATAGVLLVGVFFLATSFCADPVGTSAAVPEPYSSQEVVHEMSIVPEIDVANSLTDADSE